MHYYAQLNSDNICVGISALSGPVQSEGLVHIDALNPDYIYRRYDHETNQWSEEQFEPQTTAPLTEFEQTKQQVAALQADSLMSLEAIATLYEMLVGGVA